MNEFETKNRARLTSLVSSLKRDNGNRRIWTDEARKAVIEFYEDRYIYQVGFNNPLYFLENKDSLNIHLTQITHWIALYKKNGEIKGIGRKAIEKPTTEPLKTNSSAGNKTPGTTLQGILVGMKDMDIVSKIEMVDTLSEAGYKEETVVPYINTLPSIEDWSKIKQAVALLALEYNITKKE